MLSKENAKFKSAFPSTKSHINKESMLKIKLMTSLRFVINLIINPIIFFTELICKPSELIEDFKNSWLIVSQMLVRTIKKKMKATPCFMLPLPCAYCLKKRVLPLSVLRIFPTISKKLSFHERR